MGILENALGALVAGFLGWVAARLWPRFRDRGAVWHLSRATARDWTLRWKGRGVAFQVRYQLVGPDGVQRWAGEWFSASGTDARHGDNRDVHGISGAIDPGCTLHLQWIDRRDHRSAREYILEGQDSYKIKAEPLPRRRSGLVRR